MTSGFRALGEEEIYRGYAIRVALGRFAAPDGHEFTRDLVHHPGAVAVVPYHDDGSVTLVRQYRPAIDDRLLEIPAGIRDVAGEPLATTVARELAEEVGLAAGRIEHLVTVHNAVGHSDEQIHIFVATDLREVTASAQGPEEEAMAIERHPLVELGAMVRRGEITDAKTVIATFALLAP